MKLYATVASERATKGQGGNKSLEIIIKAQELEGIPTRQDMFRISLVVENKQLKATLWDYSEGDEILLYPRHASEPPKSEPIDDYMQKRREARATGGHVEYQTKGERQKGEHVHSYKADDVLKDWNGKGGYACTICGYTKPQK